MYTCVTTKNAKRLLLENGYKLGVKSTQFQEKRVVLHIFYSNLNLGVFLSKILLRGKIWGKTGLRGVFPPQLGESFLG